MIELPDEQLETLCLLAMDRANGYTGSGVPLELDDSDRAALEAFRAAIARTIVG